MIDLLSSGFTTTLRERSNGKHKYESRGDGRSQNVLANVAKARTVRRAEETKEELTRITQRINSVSLVARAIDYTNRSVHQKQAIIQKILLHSFNIWKGN